jgi:anti-sigma factor (TIGR02949 family)
MGKHENCHHLLDSLSEFVDGELKDELCTELERHLAECEDCRIVVDTLKKTVYLYHSTSSEPTTIPFDVKERLYKRLKIEDVIEEE